MGLFSNRIPDLSDPRLRDFNFLLQPIERLYPETGWVFDLPRIAVTVANRLAHLTNRMERTPAVSTGASARWYLDNLVDIDIDPRAVSIIEPLKRRLWNAIHEYEARIGHECDTWEFSHLVGSSDHDRCVVLYGPPMWRRGDDLGGALGPRSDLSRWLSACCWKWSTVGRY